MVTQGSGIGKKYQKRILRISCDATLEQSIEEYGEQAGIDYRNRRGKKFAGGVFRVCGFARFHAAIVRSRCTADSRRKVGQYCCQEHGFKKLHKEVATFLLHRQNYHQGSRFPLLFVARLCFGLQAENQRPNPLWARRLFT